MTSYLLSFQLTELQSLFEETQQELLTSNERLRDRDQRIGQLEAAIENKGTHDVDRPPPKLSFFAPIDAATPSKPVNALVDVDTNSQAGARHVMTTATPASVSRKRQEAARNRSYATAVSAENSIIVGEVSTTTTDHMDDAADNDDVTAAHFDHVNDTNQRQAQNEDVSKDLFDSIQDSNSQTVVYDLNSSSGNDSGRVLSPSSSLPPQPGINFVEKNFSATSTARLSYVEATSLDLGNSGACAVSKPPPPQLPPARQSSSTGFPISVGTGLVTKRRRGGGKILKDGVGKKLSGLSWSSVRIVGNDISSGYSFSKPSKSSMGKSAASMTASQRRKANGR